AKAIRIRQHLPVFQPDKTKSFSQNLLYGLTGRSDAGQARELDISLILYAEHELNASTFAGRVAASTLADLYGAVTAAIATLKGPLHGGANEAVADMFRIIQKPEKAKAWVQSQLAAKKRIMGFGHRVLKHEDPRGIIIKRRAQGLSQQMAGSAWYDIAQIIEHTMKNEKGLLPN